MHSAYEVVTEKDVNDLNSKGYLLKHKKTGARVFILSNDDDNKVHSLLSYVGSDRDVADPWYTGDFQATWDDVNAGCRAILKTFGYELDLLN